MEQCADTFCIYAGKCIEIKPNDSRAIGKETETHRCLEEEEVTTKFISECAYSFCYYTFYNYCSKLDMTNVEKIGKELYNHHCLG